MKFMITKISYTVLLLAIGFISMYADSSRSIQKTGYTVSEIREIYDSLNLSSGSTSSGIYTVIGYVTTWNSGYPDYENGDFWIEDSPYSSGGIRCFRLTNSNRTKLVEGQKVEVYGNLKNYNGTAEIVNGDYFVRSSSVLSSKRCGESLNYSYNNDTLLITGSGKMWDMGERNCPWFSYRSSVKTIIISDRCTSIGNNAFYGFKDMTNVTIPTSVTSIGSRAFSGCTSLTSITIPDSVTSIGGYVFDNCTGLTSPVYNEHIFAYMPGAFNGTYIIPSGINRIVSGAFYNSKGLTSITVPESVSSVGDVFHGCSNLTDVVWLAKKCSDLTSSNLTYLSNLSSFVFGDEVEHIPAYLCSNMENLTSVSIPKSVTSIGQNAFYNCKGLTSVHISDVASWCDISFTNGQANPLFYAKHLYMNNSELINVVIPDGVKTIKFAAFYYGSNIKSVTFPNSVTDIRKSAFCYCNSLNFVYIGDNVKNIGSYAFNECTNLIAFVPTSATTGTDTFKDCKDVRYYDDMIDDYVFANIDNQWTLIGYLGAQNGFELPNSIHEETYVIGSEVYANNKAEITSVIIPNSVTAIGKSAFENYTGLKTLSLGENITGYGEKAFAGCPALTSIYNYRKTPAKLGADAFKDVDYFNCTLYVLAGSVDMYKSSGSDWKDFYFIEPISAESASAEEVVVVPHDNSADISWPKVAEAETYELKITKDGEVFCVLVFNTQGQLVSIAFAPSRYNAAEQAQAVGFSFTVTGLNSGTQYGYSVTASNSAEEALDTKSGSFMTTTDGKVSTFDITFVVKDNATLQHTITDVPYGTKLSDLIEIAIAAVGGDSFEDDSYIYTFAGVEGAELTDIVTESTTYYILYTKTEKTPTSVSNAETSTAPLKLLRDGQLFILREGKMYNLRGQEIK